MTLKELIERLRRKKGNAVKMKDKIVLKLTKKKEEKNDKETKKCCCK